MASVPSALSAVLNCQEPSGEVQESEQGVLGICTLTEAKSTQCDVMVELLGAYELLASVMPQPPGLPCTCLAALVNLTLAVMYRPLLTSATNCRALPCLLQGTAACQAGSGYFCFICASTMCIMCDVHVNSHFPIPNLVNAVMPVQAFNTLDAQTFCTSLYSQRVPCPFSYCVIATCLLSVRATYTYLDLRRAG